MLKAIQKILLGLLIIIGTLFLLYQGMVYMLARDEILINENEPMSGMDLLKVPIVLEMYRLLDNPPTLTQRQYISDTLSAKQDNSAANELLKIIAREDDLYLGAQRVTESMQRLGLSNTYIVAPFDEEPRIGTAKLETRRIPMRICARFPPHMCKRRLRIWEPCFLNCIIVRREWGVRSRPCTVMTSRKQNARPYWLL